MSDDFEGFTAEPGAEPLANDQEYFVDTSGMALTRSLPDGFDIRTLLTFLPDPKLKQRADDAAAAALAVAVTGNDGLLEADKKLGVVRAVISEIKKSFELPADLANQLHKRLTGLRGDFAKNAESAVKTVSERIVAENRRLAQVAAEETRKAQEAADEQARADAKRAADEAAKKKAPKAIVDALREESRSAVAPPVSLAFSAPVRLSNTTVVEKWVGRLQGTADGAEPNPETQALTEQQSTAFLNALRAVLEGKLPLRVFQIDWSYVNGKAKSDMGGFDMTGFEAVDIGGTRGKGRQ